MKLETEVYMAWTHRRISCAKNFCDIINLCFSEVNIIHNTLFWLIAIVWDETWNSVNAQISFFEGIHLYDLMMNVCKSPVCLFQFWLRD